ncbi:MAG: histidine kinase, partial [Treponema sp.]|nr:histidine kinase [Treponema sp.]
MKAKNAAVLTACAVSLCLASCVANSGSGVSVTEAYIHLLWMLAAIIVVSGVVVYLLLKSLADLSQREEESSTFSRSVFLAQERERGRLYRELHDTVAQDLRALSLGMARIGGTDDGPARKRLCAQAAEVQDGILRTVRDICQSLAPPDLGVMSLQDALLRLCHNFSEKSGIECRAGIPKDIDVSFLDRERQTQLFRIAQEALANVENHSGAKVAVAVLRKEAQGGIVLNISDDGVGFDPQNFQTGDGRLGIRSMRERAALLGGELTINSSRG